MGVFRDSLNRKLLNLIPEESLKEIYGLSQSSSAEFDWIGPPFLRKLNYHAAHDIGHALANARLVGCTSFAIRNEKSSSGALIIGRTFDFNMGDEFAHNKLVNLWMPDHGHAFLSVSWPGMIGVVSGLNEKGISVTMNAAKSSVPTSSAVPISIVAQEILQFAASIAEAKAILERSPTFVSEAIMVGSGLENKAVILESRPGSFDLFESETDVLYCTNHFQGECFGSDELNQNDMQVSSSVYRAKRLRELIERKDKLTIEDCAAILRDRKGLCDSNIGNGNEKAINQLLAHHAVIIDLHNLKLWVSANPYQLGRFICYDLKSLREAVSSQELPDELHLESESIGQDAFLKDDEFAQFEQFKIFRKKFHSFKSEVPSDDAIKEFRKLNPHFWETYSIIAEIYRKQKNYAMAKSYFEKALELEIPTETERSLILNAMKKIQ